MRRILPILLVALGLAPGLFWRTELPPPSHAQQLEAVPLPIPPGEAARIGGREGPLLTGLWHLRSANADFGSYSALVASDAGTLFAFGDRGGLLRLAVPPARSGPALLRPLFPGSDGFKPMQDVESATHDPQGGRFWIGLEGRNVIGRMEPDLTKPRFVQPAAMRDWPANGGPEAMVRLADGRFVVLAESAEGPGGAGKDALLFPGDPVEGIRPWRFSFDPPPGMSPTDIAQLPDGRVLILARGVALLPWPRFETALLLADPAEIRPGRLWPWRMVAALDGPVPRDNYEGLAVTGGQDGGPVTIWIVPDDNDAALVQRSLLLRLEWRVPRE